MGVNVTINNQDVILNSDIIILAVKPYQVLDVMNEIHDTYTTVQQHAGKATSSPRSFRPLIVSVASSVTLADIEDKVCQSSTFNLVTLTGTPPRKKPLNHNYSSISLNQYTRTVPTT